MVTLEAGVPQGSVLRSFVFVLYINDINSDLASRIGLFADDTSLFVVVDNDIINSAKSFTSDLERINPGLNNGQSMPMQIKL
jgi:hypothetical protein